MTDKALITAASDRSWPRPAGWAWTGPRTLCAVLLALAMVGLSAFLAAESWRHDHLPGCGPDGGCDAALDSRWAVWLGVPVGAPAAILYTGIAAAWILRASGRLASLRRVEEGLLTAACLIIPGGAAWFIGLMHRQIEGLCVYCLVAHALGLMLTLLIVVELRGVWRRALAHDRIWLVGSVSLGVLGLGSLVGGQTLLPHATLVVDPAVAVDSTGRGDPPAVAAEFDTGPGPDRRIHLPLTSLELRVADLPRVGPADAQHLVVIFGDYACPHCHEFTDQLIRAVDRYRGQLALVRLMTPLNPQCNPTIGEHGRGPRYGASCDLAKLALALFQIDPAAFERFERWAASTPTTPTLPDAVAQAVALVGKETLRQRLQQPGIGLSLAQHVAAFAALPPEYVSMPVVVMQGHYVRGTPSAARETFELLESRLGLTPPDP